MARGKTYESTSKFVIVMPRIPWPLFFPDTVTALYKKARDRRAIPYYYIT